MAGKDAAPINESDWLRISQHLEAYDGERESLVKQSREVQKKCKQAIYLLHQGSFEEAGEQLREAERLAGGVLPTLKQYPTMRQGTFSFAMEELAQAVLLRTFLLEGRLAKSTELPMAEPEEYLSGVLDMTGELSRHAVQRATVRDTSAVERCRGLVDAVMGQFLQFDLRNSSLRRKYDGLKYRLKELENIMYELSLTEAMAPDSGAAAGLREAEPEA